MAMYENDGYCPAISFFFYQSEVIAKANKNARELWHKNIELLGDRIQYMMYSKTGYLSTGEYPSIVEFLNTNGSYEFVKKLKKLFPICKYPEFGKKILITDVQTPYLIPDTMRTGFEHTSVEMPNGERVYFNPYSKIWIRCNCKYLAAIDNEHTLVHIYLYKLPKVYKKKK